MLSYAIGGTNGGLLAAYLLEDVRVYGYRFPVCNLSDFLLLRSFGAIIVSEIAKISDVLGRSKWNPGSCGAPVDQSFVSDSTSGR